MFFAASDLQEACLLRRNPSPVIGRLRSDFRCFPLPLSPRTYFLFALVIDHCVSSRQRLSAVFGGGNCHTPQVFDSNLELDFCFLGFGLRVVKTISGTWCCLSVFHECLPYILLMLSHVFESPYHLEGGSLPRARVDDIFRFFGV